MYFELFWKRVVLEKKEKEKKRKEILGKTLVMEFFPSNSADLRPETLLRDLHNGFFLENLV